MRSNACCPPEIRPKAVRVRRLLLGGAGFALLGFVILNALAINHARAMTHFAAAGVRTRPPEFQHGLAKLRTLLVGVNLPRPANTVTPADFGLACETNRYRVSEGIVLEAWLIPHPAPHGTVLMFHGYGAAKCSMLPEAKAFHDMGYAVFLPDFRGSGGSNGNTTSLGFHEAEDVAATVRYARNALHSEGPLVLYGYSMGGAAVLRAVGECGVSPTAILVEAVFDSLLSTVRNRFSAMGVPSFPSAELLTFWGGRLAGFSGFRHNPADYARNVRCPALLLHGENDPRAVLQQSRRIFDSLPGEKRMKIFRGVKHESCLAADPQAWRAAVAGFLSASSIRSTDQPLL